jgi:putative hydrolase of the HAD superfamily
MDKIKVIAFDADDTLWQNEDFYRDCEQQFCEMLLDFANPQSVSEILFQYEMKNLELYGYGAKGFVLSCIETALVVSNHQVSNQTIQQIIDLGKKLIDQDIHLLEGVEATLKSLFGKYRLVLATKGDLLDQERKLIKSDLSKYFHHIEIMSEKNKMGYIKLMKHLEVRPDEFMMIGNSLKSDILPVLDLGGYAVHIPYHTTWQAEKVADENISNTKFHSVHSISEVIRVID